MRKDAEDRLSRETAFRSLLIVVDVPRYQDLYRFALSEHGELSIHASVEEALPRLQGRHYDLIVLDINLFGVSGLELLKAIGQRSSTEQIPVIVCSGELSVKQDAMDWGVAGFIVKPFEPEALRRMVRAMLGSGERRAEGAR